MPHDMNGTELKVGDRVLIEFVIKEIHLTEEYCNCNLDSVIPMYPSRNTSSIVINTKQCEKK